MRLPFFARELNVSSFVRQLGTYTIRRNFFSDPRQSQSSYKNERRPDQRHHYDSPFGYGYLLGTFQNHTNDSFWTSSLTENGTFIAATALATIGYFDWATRLPRSALITRIVFNGVALPIFFLPSERDRKLRLLGSSWGRYRSDGKLRATANVDLL
jgi:hypothetical protein